ncbi:hypothetical protein [Agrobacterium cavarae]|uniref:hypothetical protein n=1 Tax=Agrobacterium cavarae TaxID=2528239 RepID=UPI002FDA0A9E
MKLRFVAVVAAIALMGCSEKGSELVGLWKAKQIGADTEMGMEFRSNGDVTLSAPSRPTVTGKWRLLDQTPPEGFAGIVELSPPGDDAKGTIPAKCAYRVAGDALTFKDCDFAQVVFKKS